MKYRIPVSISCGCGTQGNINEKTLFEVTLKCIVEHGIVGNYPTTDRELLSAEEKEIELRYKDIRTYAVGHGIGVDWKTNRQNKLVIWADFMPIVEVPQVTADTGDKDSQVLQFTI